MDSTTIDCPYCGATSHMTLHGVTDVVELDTYVARGDLYMWSAAFRCDACKRLCVGTTFETLRPSDEHARPNETPSQVQARLWGRADDIDWQPVLVRGQSFDFVPQHIAEAGSEAYRCRSIDALRGAVMLARAVIEATAKDKGITDGQLFHKIERMAVEGLIRPHIKDAAHEVRHLGNDMAHGDFVDPITAEEADEILTLMSEVLEEVFTSPARVAARTAARLAKDAARTGG